MPSTHIVVMITQRGKKGGGDRGEREGGDKWGGGKRGTRRGGTGGKKE